MHYTSEMIGNLYSEVYAASLVRGLPSTECDQEARKACEKFKQYCADVCAEGSGGK